MKNYLLLLFTVSYCCSNISAQHGILSAYYLKPGFSPQPEQLTPVDDKLYFIGSDSTHGYELWSVDGTNNPVRETDIMTGSNDGARQSPYRPARMGIINKSVYFVGYNPQGTSSQYCLYEYGNTGILIKADTQLHTVSDYITYNNKLYIAGLRDNTSGLYVYDPQLQTTTHLVNYDLLSHFAQNELMARINDKIYFIAFNGGKRELHEYDITNNIHTVIADTFAANGRITNAFSLYAVGNTLYFVGETAANGKELYNYTGTIPATRLTDVNSGSAHGINSSMVHMNGKLYFNGDNGTHSSSLFTYDITSAQVAHIPSAIGNETPQAPNVLNPYFFAVHNSRICFNANTANNGTELCIFNPATATGYSVDVAPGIASSFTNRLTSFKGFLFCTGEIGGGLGHELIKYKDTTTSIAQTDKIIAGVTAYPNPTMQDAFLDIQLDNAQSFTIQVADIQGRLVYNSEPKVYSNGHHKVTIPMQLLGPGMYIYEFKTNAGRILSSGKLQKI